METETSAASSAAAESIAASVDVTGAAPAASSEPDKPAKSAREALERAFAKTSVSDDEPRQPSRDPSSGKFKAVDAATTAAKPGADKLVEQVTTDQQPPVKPAPSGFTKAAQEAWGGVPEPVRVDRDGAGPADAGSPTSCMSSLEGALARRDGQELGLVVINAGGPGGLLGLGRDGRYLDGALRLSPFDSKIARCGVDASNLPAPTFENRRNLRQFLPPLAQRHPFRDLLRTLLHRQFAYGGR